VSLAPANGSGRPVETELDLQSLIAIVREELRTTAQPAAAAPPTPKGPFWFDISKFALALLSCILAAYFSVQAALYDRPTKEEINPKIEKLNDQVVDLKTQLSAVQTKVSGVDEKVTEGFRDIKEALRKK
jgi:HEAT repeat protein